MTRFRTIAALTALALAAAITPIGASAVAATPVVYSVIEGRQTGTNAEVLVLLGNALTSIKTFELLNASDNSSAGEVTASLRTKNLVVLVPAAGLIAGSYNLKIGYGKAGTQTVGIVLTLGYPGPDWTDDGTNVTRASGRVGIGQTSPTASLQVDGDDGVLFRGGTTGTIPATGMGARMMWYPKKNALRAGELGPSFATAWDDTNIGTNSVAFGRDTTASGYASNSTGIATTASGEASTAMGQITTASGVYSVTTGFFTMASGLASTAMGTNTTASGEKSTAMGSYTTAQGFASVALGQFNVIAGGSTTVVATDPVLVVGNGTSFTTPSNAFTLLKNGNLTIAGTLTQNSDARLKQDIETLHGVLPLLAKVRGVSYRFRPGANGPEGKQMGLLAQDVREAFPDLVHEDSQGGLSVAYGNFTAVLVEAVKDQQKAIEGLNARLERLERLLERATDAPPVEHR